MPLTELKPSENGEIAYLSVGDDKKMQKLMSMGVLPGSQLDLVQKFPSYILRSDTPNLRSMTLWLVKSTFAVRWNKLVV